MSCNGRPLFGHLPNQALIGMRSTEHPMAIVAKHISREFANTHKLVPWKIYVRSENDCMLRSMLLAGMCATVLAAEMPTPALVVLNKEEATLAIVDPNSGKVTARVPT